MVLPSIFSCFCVRPRHTSRRFEKHPTTDRGRCNAYYDHPTKPELAEQIVAKLLAADKNDAALEADLQSAIHSFGWYDGLAAAVLARLEEALELGKEMGPAMRSAYEKATAGIDKVEEWAGDHPEMAAVIVTLIAIGILAVMTPWLLAWLGFAEEGIVEGKLALLISFHARALTTAQGRGPPCGRPAIVDLCQRVLCSRIYKVLERKLVESGLAKSIAHLNTQRDDVSGIGPST